MYHEGTVGTLLDFPCKFIFVFSLYYGIIFRDLSYFLVVFKHVFERSENIKKDNLTTLFSYFIERCFFFLPVVSGFRIQFRGILHSRVGSKISRRRVIFIQRGFGFAIASVVKKMDFYGTELISLFMGNLSFKL
jgi:hypothetical protein